MVNTEVPPSLQAARMFLIKIFRGQKVKTLLMMSVAVLYPDSRHMRQQRKRRREGKREKLPKHLVARNVKSLAAEEILSIGICWLAALRCEETKRMKSEEVEEIFIFNPVFPTTDSMKRRLRQETENWLTNKNTIM